MTKAVTLFIPCLVDQLYPEMGISAYQLLRAFGYEVRYHPEATCCGQPAFNAGHREEALKVARHFVDTQGQDDAPLVCVSGSCTAMASKFYPELFGGTPEEPRAKDVSGRVVEFSAFLNREGLGDALTGTHAGRVGFHNSCHSYRELGIDREPLDLLRRIDGLEVVEVGEPVCCGFGGLFSIKLPGVAKGMARSRLEAFTERDLKLLVSNDPGCIMHLRKESAAFGFELEILHLTEFLARSMELPTDSFGGAA